MATNIYLSDQSALYDSLENSVEAALEVYSNIHRGSGHFSIASTFLYEKSRKRLLTYWGLDSKDFTVIYGSPYRLKNFLSRIAPDEYYILKSGDLDLPLGVWAIGIKKRMLSHGAPYQTGGGAVYLVSPNHVIWAKSPERHEAGTPAIINALAFVRALELSTKWKYCGKESSIEDILYKDDFAGLYGEDLLTTLRPTLIGRKSYVPTTDGPQPYINLDNAASMPTFDPIWKVVKKVWRQPENIRQDIIAEVKKIISRFLNAPSSEYEIIFTANTTEAINLASLGIPTEKGIRPVVLNTMLEHHSNDLPWRYNNNIEIKRLPVNNNGFIDSIIVEAKLQEFNQLKQHGNKRITWLTVSGCSNVLGTCNDLSELAQLTHKYGARLLVDGAQVIAHRLLDVSGSGIDAFAFSGHKAYAPFGSGALIVRSNLLKWPDGEFNKAISSGEENVVGIAALGKALILLERIGMRVVEETEREMTSLLLNGLSRLPDIEIFGLHESSDTRFTMRSSVIAFSAKKIPHNIVAQELAEFGGIGVRTGCFCSHILVKNLMHISPLRSLAGDLGMILFPKFTGPLLPGLVRLSLGLQNETADIERCLNTMERIIHKPRSWRERFLALTYNGVPRLPSTNTTGLIKDFTLTTAKRVYGK